eukprot:CAMPEP_0177674878 /NCGR_PEP_ID=MMETSP0447-20121125/26844_1 /TAXON_ID=0 /ORGANISM="Stygamoeba regulata, Strain BSH-02190019" /LENGTH=99 /DNA_ID=CAMNT_0019183111 /DNA_START=211 /DNA_END=509 /DNA_ORIENTATION=+
MAAATTATAATASAAATKAAAGAAHDSSTAAAAPISKLITCCSPSGSVCASISNFSAMLYLRFTFTPAREVPWLAMDDMMTSVLVNLVVVALATPVDAF